MAHILVADDERAVREFVCRALRHDGYQVTGVEDGLQALSALAEHDFDLLLSDIVMPGLDGIALALRVARDRPGLPVLLMSGYSVERERAHGLETLTSEVITKPFTLQKLVDTVRHALAAGAASG